MRVQTTFPSESFYRVQTKPLDALEHKHSEVGHEHVCVCSTDQGEGVAVHLPDQRGLLAVPLLHVHHLAAVDRDDGLQRHKQRDVYFVPDLIDLNLKSKILIQCNLKKKKKKGIKAF